MRIKLLPRIILGIILGLITSKSYAQFFPIPIQTDHIEGLFADSITNKLYFGASILYTANGIPIPGFAYYDFTTQLVDTIHDTGILEGGDCRRIKRVDSLIYWLGSAARIDSIGDTIVYDYMTTNGSKWIDPPEGNKLGLGNPGTSWDATKFGDSLLIAGELESIGGNVNATGIVAGYYNGNWFGYPPTSTGNGNTGGALIKYKNDLYVGGQIIDNINNIEDITRFDGIGWNALGTPWSGAVSSVLDMIEFNGLLFIGGYFTTAAGDPGNSVAAWDGTQWIPIPGVDGVVSSFAILNGELYIGGYFYIGTVYSGFAKWDGSNWISLASINNGGVVRAITPLDNSMYIGGFFTSINGQPFDNIAEYRTTVGLTEIEQPIKLSVYPNPVKDHCTVMCPLTWKDETVNVSIVNTNGQTVFTKEDKLNNGRVNLQLPLLPTSIYQLIIKTKNNIGRTSLSIY